MENYDCLMPNGIIVIDDFSEINGAGFKHRTIVEKDLFNKYVERYKTEKGIL